jgi:uncharacterized protein YjiS (DUF1127 family)
MSTIESVCLFRRQIAPIDHAANLALKVSRWGLSSLPSWPARVTVQRQLRSLCELDDHILKDIGLTRAEIAFEARKPFWRR